jgi:Zn-dependent peptidase ImmA (M78 family)
MFKLPNPEQIANKLLEQTEQTSPPVKLEDVVSLWKELNLEFDDIKHEGYFIDLGGFGKEIIVRSSAPLSRQRFTIAHEIGHLILQEHQIVFDGCISFRREEGGSNFVEKWCDRFAVALLMPKEWILRDIRQRKIKGLVQSLLDLPDAYKVSTTAFRRRVSEITPLSIFDVKQTNRNLFIERIIENKYESRAVKKFYLGQTMEELLPNLEYSTEPIKHIHSKTRMLSIYILIKNDLGIHKWTVCILPDHSS